MNKNTGACSHTSIHSGLLYTLPAAQPGLPGVIGEGVSYRTPTNTNYLHRLSYFILQRPSNHHHHHCHTIPITTITVTPFLSPPSPSHHSHHHHRHTIPITTITVTPFPSPPSLLPTSPLPMMINASIALWFRDSFEWSAPAYFNPL